MASSHDSKAGTVTAALLIIGDEILSGRTQDSNLATLARALKRQGIALREARVVPDVADEIIAAVTALKGRYSYVFTTGGIGPTHDDITAAAVARAFGRPLLRDPEALSRLQRHYNPGDLNAARLKMADVPEGAALIDNPVSAAPGFRVDNVHVLAGVPKIMAAMLDGLLPTLAGGPPLLSCTVVCEGVGEGVLAEGLVRIEADHPGVSVGSYPFFRLGRLGTSLVARSHDADLLAAAGAALADLVRDYGGTPEMLDGEPGT